MLGKLCGKKQKKNIDDATNRIQSAFLDCMFFNSITFVKMDIKSIQNR